VRFTITGAGGSTRGVIAKFGHVFDDNDEPRTEFEHFRRFNERYPQRPFACPRALDHLPEHGALLTEEIRGPMLLELIRGRHRFLRLWPDVRTSMLVTRCAQWLRAFHHMETQPEMRPLEERDLASLTKYLELLLAYGAMTPEWVARIRSVVGRALDARLPCRIAHQHGDFGASNIIVDRGDRVIILDVSNNQRGPVLRDVAYCATGLRMISRFAVVTGGKLFPIYARNFIDAYLDGHDADRQPQIIALYELEALLRVMARHRRWALKRASRWTAGLMKRYARRVYDRALDHLLTRLEQPHPEVATS
jgi:aminoglycoside phosphotransferase (APT) family kinase protein